jgi:hypothetical protein
MIHYALILMIVLCPFLSAYGNIFNGFTNEKDKLKKQLDALEVQIEKSSDSKEIKKLTKKLSKIHKQYEMTLSNYEATEDLLAALNLIDPNLYKDVDGVVDAEGSLTHVYVKVMARNSGKFADHASMGYSLAGYTNLGHWEANPNVYASEYGVYTVSVVIGNTTDKLSALAHEFGHVLYQVQNLKSYTEYYNQQYDLNNVSKFGLGHHPMDPGNAFVKSIESGFIRKIKEYHKISETATTTSELIAKESSN